MNTILVPTDFSKGGRSAIRYAIAFAEQTGSRLIFSHITFATIPTRASKTAYEAAIQREIERQTEKLIREIEKIYRAMHKPRQVEKADIIVSFGLSVTDNLLDNVKATKAKLIIMGTHGATGMKKILFGSNTASLISKATVPVLAIPESYRFREIRKIIHASDLADISKEIRATLPWAQALQAAIEVVYFDYGWDTHKDRKAQFQKAVQSMDYTDIRLVEKKAAIEISLEENLRQYLKRQRAYMLATFTADRTFFEKIVAGSMTQELAYDLKFPLLSVRKSILNSTAKK